MNGLHNGLYNGLIEGLHPGLFDNEPNSGYDSDMIKFFEAGNFDGTHRRATKYFISNCKKYGIWNKIIAYWPIMVGTAANHKLNMKDPRDTDSAFRLTFFGNLSHSPTGMKGVSGGYADTHVIPSANLLLNDCHLCFYARTAGSLSSIEMGSAAAGGPYTLLQLKYTNSWFYGDVNQTTEDGVLNPFPVGFHLATRTASNVKKLMIEGKVLLNGVAVSTGLNSRSMFLMCQNNNGTAGFFTTRECAGAGVGYGLTVTEAFIFSQIVKGTNTILGRNVY